MKILEFRSDTFTKPTPAMRRAIGTTYLIQSGATRF